MSQDSIHIVVFKDIAKSLFKFQNGEKHFTYEEVVLKLLDTEYGKCLKEANFDDIEYVLDLPSGKAHNMYYKVVGKRETQTGTNGKGYQSVKVKGRFTHPLVVKTIVNLKEYLYPDPLDNSDLDDILRVCD